MLTKPITYTDFNDNKRTEDFLFNLTEAELIEMELGKTGGFSEMLKKIVASNDQAEMLRLFKEIILKSYGVKSEDGRSFLKSEQLRNDFACTAAFSALYTELMSDASAATDFVNNIMPRKIAEQMKESEVQKNLKESVKGFPEVNNN